MKVSKESNQIQILLVRSNQAIHRALLLILSREILLRITKIQEKNALNDFYKCYIARYKIIDSDA